MINVVPADRQLSGSFDGGKITEKKVIGFPHEIGTTKAYSNLFYWAYAKSVSGGIIGQHPHKGFEIITYVVAGEIEHFDTQISRWNTLQQGDLQIIKAGSGLEHSEKLKPGAEIFQIWFDPDIRKTLSTEPSYNDFKKSDFPHYSTQGTDVEVLVGPNSPATLESPGVEIKIISGSKGTFSQAFSANDFFSVFVMEGIISGNNTYLQKGDFVAINAALELTITSEDNWKIFLIKSPAAPGYKTYVHNSSF